LHKGQVASSAEALMRSRYTAFALNLQDYLLSSWHPSTRPERIELSQDTQWRRLEIIDVSNDDVKGRVHFKAYYQEPNQDINAQITKSNASHSTMQWHLIEEKSGFVFERGNWFYLSGDYQSHSLKPNRNDACLCGSGKKFKKCCL
jgi:SEC-C motif-containing protein